MVDDLLPQRRLQPQPVLAAHAGKDAAEFAGVVVGELDEARETGMQAGVGIDEMLHRFRIAGHDDDEPFAVVLHALQQRLDGLRAEVGLVLGQAVGLVDEEDAVERGIDHGVRPRRGLADVFRDEAGAVALDQMALLQQPERAVDAAHETGHGRLARAGIADEDGVVARWDGRQSLAGPQLLEPREVRQLPDLLLHGGEADELVQLGQERTQLVDTAGHPFARPPRTGGRCGDLLGNIFRDARLTRCRRSVEHGEEVAHGPSRGLDEVDRLGRELKFGRDAHDLGELTVHAFTDVFGHGLVHLRDPLA